MSQAGRHVIRRECIDLAVDGGESEGLALQSRVAALCQGALATALDQVFARAAPGGQHWQFERIEVDAGRFTPESFERDFVAAVAAAVEEQVRLRKEQAVLQPDLAAGEGDLQRSGGQSIQQAWLYFLATGVLPWWCHLPEGRTLEALVSESWGAAPGQGGIVLAPLRAALPRTLAAPVARLRLARQFSAAFLERLLERLAPGAPAVLREVVAQVHRELALAAPAAIPEAAWAAAFAGVAARRATDARHLLEAWAALAPQSMAPELVDRLALRLAAHDGAAALKHDGVDTATTSERQGMTSKIGSNGPDRDNHPSNAAPQAERAAATPGAAVSATAPDLHEGVFVDCAGVVLLHAFLPHLFKRRGVSVDDRLAEPDRALALLHFLATGQASAPEHALVLPKLLCGLEPSWLAGAPVALSEEDRADAESLLRAAIGYWPAIGQTSLDGFRGNFLVRPGKLSRRGEDDLLQVEKRTWDVLLGQLPWGIGMVRLPWMPRMLWVEWPY